MYRRMLIPLDGSELAEVVFTYAKELAGRLDMDLILLHVCSPAEHDFMPMHKRYIEQAAETIGRHSQEVQERTGIQPGTKKVEAKGELVVGHAAEEILHYTDENEVDLILMATHGSSGIRRWAIGGVADKVLRASKIPVWLSRAEIPDEIVYDQWPKRTMLVPLDGSELAESVLPHVEALAKQRGAELVDVVLLRVCEPLFISADYPEASMPLTWDEHVRQITDHCKQISAQYLAAVEKQLKDAGLRVQSEVLMGSPGNEIIEYVRKIPLT